MAKVKERPEAPAYVDPIVTVRVTKRGDGLISNGVHVPRLGDEYYEWNEEFSVARSIAVELEERGLVEIQVRRVAEPEPAVVEFAASEAPAPNLPQLDHDHDGKPGGSLPRRGRPPKA